MFQRRFCVVRLGWGVIFFNAGNAFLTIPSVGRRACVGLTEDQSTHLNPRRPTSAVREELQEFIGGFWSTYLK